jgi:hypothetical protein
MSARIELAAALKADVADVDVIRDLRDLSTIDPALRGALQLVRTRIEPADTQGAFWQDFELWVAASLTDPVEVEDPLEDLVDDVILALDKLMWLTWSNGRRDNHPSGHPAYVIDVRARTTR